MVTHRWTGWTTFLLTTVACVRDSEGQGQEKKGHLPTLSPCRPLLCPGATHACGRACAA